MFDTNGKNSTCKNEYSKFLSICMCGKDDDYMPDFLYRITTTLNHFVRNLKQLGRLGEVEILVTDWGSPIPMAQTLELLKEASDICRFIYVSPEVIKATQEGREYFHTARAVNVALRRASGQFILLTSADQLMLKYSLEAMLKLLERQIKVPMEVNRTLMMIPRLEVPWQFLKRQPTLDEWDRYLFLNEYSYERKTAAILNVFGGSGGLLLHNDIYNQLRGLDERLTGWGWTDIDFGLRVTQNYSFQWLSNIGVFLYHMGHPPTGRRVLEVAKGNPQIYNSTPQVNNEAWGLGGFVLEEQKSQKKSVVTYNEYEISDIRKTSNLEHNTRVEIVDGLQSGDVKQHVIRIMRLFMNRGWNINRSDFDALFFLAWYSCYQFPHRYLEIGAGKGYGTGVVAAACPNVEIYGVDHWEGVITGKTPVALSYVLYEIGFRGYLRFVSGNISTAIPRLKRSFVGHFSIDLSFIRLDLITVDTQKYLLILMSHIAPGGALVLNSCKADYFREIADIISEKYPDIMLFESATRKTGMFVKASSKDYCNVEPKYLIFEHEWFLAVNKKAKFKKRIKKIFRPLSGFVKIILTYLKQ